MNIELGIDGHAIILYASYLLSLSRYSSPKLSSIWASRVPGGFESASNLGFCQPLPLVVTSTVLISTARSFEVQNVASRHLASVNQLSSKLLRLYSGIVSNTCQF